MSYQMSYHFDLDIIIKFWNVNDDWLQHHALNVHLTVEKITFWEPLVKGSLKLRFVFSFGLVSGVEKSAAYLVFRLDMG